MTKTNPYITANPVGGSTFFIGRTDVLRDVLRVLKNPNENGMVLYGQRRIGKTSVLKELKAKLPAEGQYLPVFFDPEGKASLSSDQILRQLADRISKDLNIPPPDNLRENFSEEFREDFFPYIISRLPDEAVPVFLFDEFDIQADFARGQAGTVFFPYLRDLMNENSRRIKFIFAVGRRPEDLGTGHLSLFKFMKSKCISLLSPEDTAALVRLSEKNDSLKWPDAAVSEIYHITSGHPYLTQQLCQVIWDRKCESPSAEVPDVSIGDIREAVPESLENAKNSLEWLWDGLDAAERITASAMAQSGQGVVTPEMLEKCLEENGVRILIGELQDAPRVLELYDIIETREKGWCIRVELLRRWIAEQKSLSRIQDELDRVSPAADNLFQRAYELYKIGSLEETIPILHRTVSLNPNHLKAGRLLAEVLLARGNTAEAAAMLETLYSYNPSAARPRLVQALLSLAEKEKEEAGRIALYERILTLKPDQPEAFAGCRKFYERQGDEAFEKNELDIALAAYKKAGAAEKIEKVNKRFQLETLYQQSLDALQRSGVRGQGSGDEARSSPLTPHPAPLTSHRKRAAELLADIVFTEPLFREATRYLHLAVTGVDASLLLSEIGNLKTENAALKSGGVKHSGVQGSPAPAYFNKVGPHPAPRTPHPAPQEQKSSAGTVVGKKSPIQKKPASDGAGELADLDFDIDLSLEFDQFLEMDKARKKEPKSDNDEALAFDIDMMAAAQEQPEEKTLFGKSVESEMERKPEVISKKESLEFNTDMENEPEGLLKSPPGPGAEPENFVLLPDVELGLDEDDEPEEEAGPGESDEFALTLDMESGHDEKTEDNAQDIDFSDIVVDMEKYRNTSPRSVPDDNMKTGERRPRGILSFMSGREGEFELSKEVSTIGKKPDSDIVVSGFMMGQIAAAIANRLDGYYLSHVGGMTKPKLNGEIVKDATRLSPFDIIEIGPLKMQFSHRSAVF